MRGHYWLPALVLVLGMGLPGLLPAPAAESAEAARIARLIEQMGSGNFEEREKATEALEAIGVPALEALRKAADSEDVEVKRRAGELVKKLEKKAETDRVLAPKKIHLVCKDTPLAAAVADLARKSGYPIKLYDPENKLKDRTVTLDTGETTFWHALGLFCQEASLSEATPQDLMPRPIQPVPPPLGAPGVLPVNPPAGAAPPVPKPAVQPVPPQPARADKPGAAPREETPPAPPANKAQPAANPAAPAAAPPVRILPAGPVAAPMIRPVGFNALQPGEITLVDRKPEAVPTSDTTAIRVRIEPSAAQPVRPAGRDLFLVLQVSPEPRLRWQNYTTIRIDKAVDDQDQKLAQADSPVPGGVGIGVARPGVVRPHIVRWTPPGMSPTVPVQLKKGDKESKSLKELSGTIAANLLTEVQECIAVEKVLEAAGKTVKGTEGGSIKVTDVVQEAARDGSELVTILFEPEPPAGVVPEHNPYAGGTPQVRPIPLPVRPPVPAGPAPAAPAPPPAAPPPPPAGGAAVGIKVGVAIAPVPGTMTFTGPFQGLALLDDKGNILPVKFLQQFKPGVPGGPATVTYQFTYHQEKDKPAPAKLVFQGRKSVTIDVPFTLKDVKLP